ncbi:phosphinothricin N-acetyltransferase [Actinomycetospora sp. NBRC 106375]|uniref:GNAT family N-acetyltransferase n=1 Tax=Actinomycetospora sp. NBRC 106375 TaxID=3032207 RepID=UPI0024A1845A|nr:GNAT family N-acetyltransferase [Actinomycetospora sp. NBRC 106375]GLZ47503.1 phosphinothricin N-acetyltransferase [Actinomycetospora sp. NBRC 106375]
MSTDPATATGVLRPAAAQDAERVAAIFAGYVLQSIATFVEEPPSDEYWRERIAGAHPGLPFLVAEVDGEVEGFAYAAPFRPHAAYRYTVEDSIYIAPEAAGRGLGSRLLAGLLDEVRPTEVRQVVAVIAALPGSRHDTPSIVLHRRLGFVEVGRMSSVGYKNGQWADTVLMQIDLRPDG